MKFILSSIFCLLTGVALGDPAPYVLGEHTEVKMLLKDHGWHAFSDETEILEIIKNLDRKSLRPTYNEQFLHRPGNVQNTPILYFEIINPHPIPKPISIILASNGEHLLQLAQQGPSGEVVLREGGFHSETPTYFPRFQLRVEPGLNKFHLIAQGNILYLPIWIGTEDQIDKLASRRLYFVSSLIGAALIISLGSLVLFLFFREALLFWYFTYCTTTTLMICLQTTMPVLLYSSFLKDHNIIYADLLNLSMIFELIATMFFINNYLNIPATNPKLSRFCFLYSLVFPVSLVVMPYNHNFIKGLVASYVVIITSLFVYSIVKKIPAARQGFVSWAFYLFGISFTIGSVGGDFSLGLKVGWICYVIEMVLFGGLSAQKIYRHMLRINDQRNHSYSQLEKLVYPSQLDQMMKGSLLENTMPTSRDTGAILCFDIEESTKLGHVENHNFFKEFLLESQLLMTQGLEVDGEICFGYRLKEMGDGFICSFGYPLKTTWVPPQRVAETFAREFQLILQRIGERHFGHEVNCGIGISFGTLGGFFPNGGIQQYDMYGRPLIMASRFEQFRKTLKQDLNLKGSLCVIGENVFEALSSEDKSKYSELNFDELSKKVKNLKEEERVYMTILNDSELDTNKSV